MAETGHRGRTEITQLDVGAVADEQVVGLDVPVNDAVGVKVLKRFHAFENHVQRGFDIHQLAVSGEVLERAAGHVFADDVVVVGAGGGIEHPHHVRMLEFAEQRDLGEESASRQLVPTAIRGARSNTLMATSKLRNGSSAR